MFGPYPAGFEYAGDDLVTLLGLSVDLMVLGPSAGTGELLATISANFEHAVDTVLNIAIADGDKPTIATIEGVATRAGMTTLANNARTALGNP